MSKFGVKRSLQDAWMVHWILLGRPDALPWDMLATIPNEVLQSAELTFIDSDDHVLVSRSGAWYYVMTDLPPRDPLPEGVIHYVWPKGLGPQIPRYQAKSMEPIRALLQALYKLAQP